MRYRITLTGVSPIIMHNGAAGLDTRSPAKLEIASITKKRGSNRTEADDLRLVELECQNALYVDHDGRPTLPAAADSGGHRDRRAEVEAGSAGARGAGGRGCRGVPLRHGAIRTTVEALGKSAQFTVPVTVHRARILRIAGHVRSSEVGSRRS